MHLRQLQVRLFVRLLIDGVFEIIGGLLGVTQCQRYFAQHVEQLVVGAVDAIGILGCL